MKNRSNKIFKILHKDKEIDVIIKKNKLSRNYKLTFDKKRLSGLVSIPKHTSFGNGFSFARENANWLIEQYNEMMPIINVASGININFEGERKKSPFSECNCDGTIHGNKHYDALLNSWKKND